MADIGKKAKIVQARRAKLKLLPCPFCGGKAKWGGGIRRYEFQLAIECTQCGINTGPIPHGRGDDTKAAKIWNRRVPSRTQMLNDEFGPSPKFSSKKELKALIIEGFESGPAKPMTPKDWAKIRGRKT